eukprot:Clim_evm27s210 gene=Clim_evmTU27s210
MNSEYSALNMGAIDNNYRPEHDPTAVPLLGQQQQDSNAGVYQSRDPLPYNYRDAKYVDQTPRHKRMQMKSNELDENSWVARWIQYIRATYPSTRAWLQWLSPRAACLIFVVLLSFSTRLWNLSNPPSVVWDETHFGKFANYYMKGQFYFDVHPPLAKILIGGVGAISGYDAKFDFEKPGEAYGKASFYGMRFLCACFGAMIPVVMYATLTELGASLFAATFGAFLIIADPYSISLSRYILLDPFLNLFIVCSLFWLAAFHNVSHRPWTPIWWGHLAAIGVFLALTFSVKWVGLFVILFAGLNTVKDLWDLLGDRRLSDMKIVEHFGARVACLIILPIIVYLMVFALHFKILYHSGPGDGHMSSAFQSTLVGNELYGNSFPRHLAYGSKISLKNFRPGGSLLHSHPHNYPEGFGAPQQQVTAYSFKDSNNHWYVKSDDQKATWSEHLDAPEPKYVKDKDVIRLEHAPTKLNLHSHNMAAPITSGHHQVTCYGPNGNGDVNDLWRIEVVSDGGPDGEIVVPDTQLRLVHVTTGYALFSHNEKLPKWGYEQQEVTATPETKHPNTVWNVEFHEHPKLKPSTGYSGSVSFLYSVYELHVAMFQVNESLKPQQGEITSQPWEWPLMTKLQHMTGWGEKDTRVVMGGNPLIFYGHFFAIILFLIVYGINLLRKQRQAVPIRELEHLHGVEAMIGWLLVAYVFHFFPFFAMKRVLYFHHYWPSLIIGCMFFAIFLDYVYDVICSVSGSKRLKFYAGAASFAIIGFFGIMFAPMAYGMTGPVAEWRYLKWSNNWAI